MRKNKIQCEKLTLITQIRDRKEVEKFEVHYENKLWDANHHPCELLEHITHLRMH